ncbi:MAG: YheT family hydrolase [Gemmatimonadota bacterium]
MFRRPADLPWTRERWATPDDDFLELLRLPGSSPSSPALLLLHGLEGSAESAYVAGILSHAWSRGWHANLLLFRTCGEEMNRQPRSYHSGETTDLAFVAQRLSEELPHAPLVLAGVSLGGNVMLKWLGEPDARGRGRVAAACAISVPFDLDRCCAKIDTGFSRIYSINFLRGLRRKALAKLDRHPGMADRARVLRARTLREFDDAWTSVVHGFADAADYYRRSSSLQFLPAIGVPTLLLSSRDDPFYPPGLLDVVERVASENPLLHCEFVDRGGHAAFIEGAHPWAVSSWSERRAIEFLHLELQRGAVDS